MMDDLVCKLDERGKTGKIEHNGKHYAPTQRMEGSLHDLVNVEVLQCI